MSVLWTWDGWEPELPNGDKTRRIARVASAGQAGWMCALLYQLLILSNYAHLSVQPNYGKWQWTFPSS